MNTNVMQLHLRVLEALDIAKMDFFSKTDPYCIIELSSGGQRKRTRTVNNTLKPRWNEEFVFNVTNIATDSLQITMYDKDVGTDEAMSRLSVQLTSLPVGRVLDQWFDMNPARGVKKGGRIHLILHLAELGRTPFQTYDPTFRSGFTGAAQAMMGVGMGMAGYPYPPAYPPAAPAYPAYPPQYPPQYPAQYPPQYPAQYPAQYPQAYPPQPYPPAPGPYGY